MVTTPNLLIKRIRIKNFKSLKDVSLEINDLNVVVGKNASGKTNLVDAISFLKEAITEVTVPYAPHRRWWSYKDVVWNGDEGLPIIYDIEFEVKPYLEFWTKNSERVLKNLSYGVAFVERDGVFQTYMEYLELPNIFRIEREGSILRIFHDYDFISTNWYAIRDFLRKYSEYLLERWKDRMEFEKVKKMPKIIHKTMSDRLEIEDILHQEIQLPYRPKIPMLVREVYFRDIVPRWRLTGLKEDFPREYEYFPAMLEIYLTPLSYIGLDYRPKVLYRKFAGDIYVIMPKIGGRYNYTESLMNKIVSSVFNSLSRIQILKKLNYSKIKQPKEQVSTITLDEDSGNIQELLYTWFLKPPVGSLPERIEKVIENLFPNTRITFETTTDARIFIKIIENNEREIRPPGISDGFYKILAVLSAIELKPSLLVIDEFETSLHAEAIEYLLDEIKHSENMKTILTTHSPHVVDLTNPEDIIIVQKRPEKGSSFERLRDVEGIKKKLNELGLTFSVLWLYGSTELGDERTDV